MTVISSDGTTVQYTADGKRIATLEETPAPAIDQVWADMHRTSQGRRTVVIKSVDATHARCVTRTDTDGKTVRKLRITRIRLNRFKPISGGYALVLEDTDGTK
jgi:hypothetical protein